jgi:hypothetical protein
MVKKYLQKKDKKTKEDSADDFIQKQNRNWYGGARKISDQSTKTKKEFFKNKERLSKFLPECEKETNSAPDRLGFFETKFGGIAVGYDKFKKNSKIVFGLMPVSDKNSKTKNANRGDDDSRNYFGKYFTGRQRKFKISDVGFVYNPQNKNLRKVNESYSDGKIETENELLFDDNLEEERIDNLKTQKKAETHTGKSKINEAVDELNEIKKEKKQENLEFRSEIENFIKNLENHKLTMFVDSEDVNSSLMRLIKNRNDFLFIIKKRIEEMLKSGKAKNLKDALSKIDISQENKKYIEKIFLDSS